MEYDWTGARTRRTNQFRLGIVCVVAASLMMVIPVFIGLV